MTGYYIAYVNTQGSPTPPPPKLNLPDIYYSLAEQMDREKLDVISSNCKCCFVLFALYLVRLVHCDLENMNSLLLPHHFFRILKNKLSWKLVLP